MVRVPRKSNNPSNIISNTKEHPEFFKIYLPEHNSKALCIPPAFIDNFKGKIPKKAILQNSQGKSWKVELNEVGGRLLINKGWEDYVSSHSLERGEFLIFRYYGNGFFAVKVFGINGCKKEEPTTTSHQPRVKVKQETILEQVVDHHIDAYEQKHPKRCKIAEARSQGEPMTATIPGKAGEFSNIRFTKFHDIRSGGGMFIPAWIIKGYNITPPQVSVPETISLRNQRGFSQPAIICQTTQGRVKLACGWKEFCLKQNFAQGDECEYEIVLGEGRRFKEIILVNIGRKRTVTRNNTIVL